MGSSNKKIRKLIVAYNLSSIYQIYNFLCLYINRYADEIAVVKLSNYWGTNVFNNDFLNKVENEFNIKFILPGNDDEKLKSVLLKYNSSDVDFVTVNDIPLSNRFIKRGSRITIIEDGIGYYAKKRTKVLRHYDERGTIAALREMAKQVMLTLIAKSFKVDKFTLFNNDLSPNYEFIDAWQRVDTRMKSGESCSSDNQLIYCSQPLSELGYISSGQEYKLIDSIYEKSLSNDKTFWIKKHPVESEEKFSGYNVFKENCNVEFLFRDNVCGKKSEVVSLCSTSLLTLSLIYSISTFYIDVETKLKLDSRQKYLFETYSGIFN